MSIFTRKEWDVYPDPDTLRYPTRPLTYDFREESHTIPDTIFNRLTDFLTHYFSFSITHIILIPKIVKNAIPPPA